MGLTPSSRLKPSENYVLDLGYSARGSHLAAALSNDAVHLLSVGAEGALKAIDAFTEQQAFVNQLSFPSAEQPHRLFVATSSGHLRSYDVASGQQVEGCSTDDKEIFTFATNDKYIAAGCKGELFLWDRHSLERLALLDDTHAEDVVQVHFHPAQPNLMLSASLDGLVNVFDFSEGIDEDNAFKAALNWDASIARMGFCGARLEHLWLTSNTEGLCLWEWQAACDEEGAGQHMPPRPSPNFPDIQAQSPAFKDLLQLNASPSILHGGEGPLAELHDARELLTAALTLHDAGLGLRHPIVRLLGCEQDPHSDQLLALASSEDGLLAAFPMQYPASSSPAGGFTFGQPLYVLVGGHAEVIRSYCWPAHGDTLAFTGSEDGYLASWRVVKGTDQQAEASIKPAAAAAAAAAAAGASSKNKKGVKRRKPLE